MTDKNFATKQSLARKIFSQYSLCQDVLSQDLFSTTSLNTLSANELSQVVSEEIKWPLLMTSSSSMQLKDISDVVTVQCKAAAADINIKRLLNKEVQFVTSEL